MIRIYRAKNYQELSRKAANIISAQIIIKPNCVLGLATGSSPIGTYRQLTEWYEKGDLDFREVKTVNLDEYVGLSGTDHQSYRYFMNDNLFNHVNIDRQNTNVPNGKAADLQAECKRYNELIRSLGGIDMQLLGIGRNGHIGFNEPEEAFEKETHIVNLTDSTIEANARLFDNIADVPGQAITMGIKSIMQAKRILLIASGKDKADAIQKTLFGPVSPKVPASILQIHQNLTVVADDDALSECGLGSEGMIVC
ncbi:glucosamine-6-phosphate deaminase [Oribacterium sp. WCC10]|nr:glucosamine-6-phosphate deaminase [Oribacterium sp. WCC10]SFG16393.1 glucosamine-6-phosphate deaminase [Oribacterium sp. WCC10]